MHDVTTIAQAIHRLSKGARFVWVRFPDGKRARVTKRNLKTYTTKRETKP